MAAELNAPPDAEERGKLLPARLGEKLRRIRIHYRLTQGEMLRLINPTEFDDNNRARVSQYEHSERALSLIELYNYARYAGVTMETLVDDELDLPAWIRDPDENIGENGDQPAQEQSAGEQAGKTKTINDGDLGTDADVPPAKHASEPEDNFSPEAETNESFRAEAEIDTEDTEPASSSAMDVYSLSLSEGDAGDCKVIYLNQLGKLPFNKMKMIPQNKFLELMILAARATIRRAARKARLPTGYDFFLTVQRASKVRRNQNAR